MCMVNFEQSLRCAAYEGTLYVGKLHCAPGRLLSPQLLLPLILGAHARGEWQWWVRVGGGSTYERVVSIELQQEEKGMRWRLMLTTLGARCRGRCVASCQKTQQKLAACTLFCLAYPHHK